MRTEFISEGLLQIDLAESFVCEGQDEVQNAKWNQRKLTYIKKRILFHRPRHNIIVIINMIIPSYDFFLVYQKEDRKRRNKFKSFVFLFPIKHNAPFTVTNAL